MKNTPGRPCIKLHWTSSAKDGVGTAIRSESRVWFTLYALVNPSIGNQATGNAEETSRARSLGAHVTDLSSGKPSSGETLQFTFYWPDAERWEEKNFEIKVR